MPNKRSHDLIDINFLHQLVPQKSVAPSFIVFVFLWGSGERMDFLSFLGSLSNRLETL